MCYISFIYYYNPKNDIINVVKNLCFMDAIMADKHDAVFKDLIANKDFAISFLQQYMPSELVSLVDWKTVKLDSANVEHTRQQQKINLKQKEQSDLTFLFKFQDGKDGAVFVHIE